MPTVELRFSALPAHVRTARLVAAAVARRSGVEEALLDEVRLAVGEACSRAVDLHRRYCPDQLVTITLASDPQAFRVAVLDRAPVPAAVDGADPLSALDVDAVLDAVDGWGKPLEEEPLPPGVGLAVVSGLVDDLSVERLDPGLAVRMTWPSTGP